MSGYDAWRTREPVERRFEEELVWRVDGYSPHQNDSIDLGEYHSERDALIAGQTWLEKMQETDREYRDDYWFDVHEHNLLEACTCYGKLNRDCPLHGIDPDAARDAMLDL